PLSPLPLHSSRHLRDLSSFPTRRSSDLVPVRLFPWHIVDHDFKHAVEHAAGDDMAKRPVQLRDFFSKPAQHLHVFQGIFHLYFRSEEHTSELQSRFDLVCRLLLEKKKKN